ncbi:MAG: aspartate kinase [Deltaproteobacteria bacterium]|nr:aspartate kinase [Deltaproteobacteria bacterium]
MALVVHKYGGTSVGSIEKIRSVAKKVAKVRDEGNLVIVVVSAMSGETNKLVAMANEMTSMPDEREYDALISTGEQITSTLLAMALNSMGYPAVSFQGYQIKIVTDSAFTKARIQRIDADNLRKELKAGKIITVSGFQGVDEAGNVTTLGRGGSDTTAVAIAAALKADECIIYTDVDGVYTADPNICPNARKLDRVTYEEMLEMASLGAKVLQIRSVEFGMKYNVPIRVKSTFVENEGTLVAKEEDKVEAPLVSGVAYDKNEAKITVVGIPDRPGIASKLFTPISEANINVDMIVQNISAEGHTDLTFTVPKSDFKKALEIVKKIAKDIEARNVVADENIAKVSVIGVGMRSHSGIAARMFDLLSKEGINIMMISTSEIKVSCVIDTKYTELAVRVLHDGFGLGK